MFFHVCAFGCCSTSGCPFGEGCHFLHYVPGYSAVKQFTNVGGPIGRKPPIQQHHPQLQQQPSADASLKSKLCNRINTPEGCKFGDKCRFAHSEVQLGSKSSFPSYEDPRGQPGPINYSGGGGYQPAPPGLAAAANFGQSATAKISIDGALAGPIIGKGGVNSKQICRLTGVKFAIRDHDTDQNQKNIELEGSFDQIKEASSMVREIIMNLGANGGGRKGSGFQQQQQQQQPGGGNNFKTKMCENFAKGRCSFGERCLFAHGADELRT